jgi:hypothetical protein
MLWLDVSKECNGTSIFRATKLVLVDAEMIRRKVCDCFSAV